MRFRVLSSPLVQAFGMRSTPRAQVAEQIAALVRRDQVPLLARILRQVEELLEVGPAIAELEISPEMLPQGTPANNNPEDPEQ